MREVAVCRLEIGQEYDKSKLMKMNLATVYRGTGGEEGVG